MEHVRDRVGRRRFDEAFENVDDREDNPRLIRRHAEWNWGSLPALPPSTSYDGLWSGAAPTPAVGSVQPPPVVEVHHDDFRGFFGPGRPVPRVGLGEVLGL